MKKIINFIKFGIPAIIIVGILMYVTYIWIWSILIRWWYLYIPGIVLVTVVIGVFIFIYKVLPERK